MVEPGSHIHDDILTATVLFDAETVVAVREILPDAGVFALRYATHLGDGAFLAVLVVLYYWFADDRETAAFVAAVGVGCLALTVGLKGVVARPRPPAEVALVAETGYSLPSGHALGATVVYGLFAVILDLGNRWQRYAVAGTLIAVISSSRVVIGVHYPGDVIIGVVVGVVYLAFVLRYLHDAERAFLLAFVVALVGVALGSREYSALAVGASAGGFLVWSLLTRRSDAKPSSVSVLAVAVSFGVFFAVAAFLRRAIVETPLLETATALFGYAVITGAVLAIPYLASYLDGSFDLHLVRRQRD